MLIIVVAKLKIIKNKDSNMKKKNLSRLCVIIRYKLNKKEADEKKKSIIAKATKIRKIRI